MLPNRCSASRFESGWAFRGCIRCCRLGSVGPAVGLVVGSGAPDQVESCGPKMRREQLAYNEADDARVPAPPMCQQSSSVSWWATCAR